MRNVSNLSFLLKCKKEILRICLADLYFIFLSQAKEGQKRIFFTNNELITYDYFPHPLPDAYLATQEGDKAWRYFLEVIEKTARKAVIHSRMRKYFTYALDGYWQATTAKPLPNVLVIVPDERRKRLLKRFIKEQREQSYATDLYFYVSTKETIEANGFTANVWEKI